MSKYLKHKVINESNNSYSKAILKDLKYFIRDYKLDEEIEKHLPISKFGDEQDDLCIGGSKDIIRIFEEIDTEKIDIIESIENITYEGISDNREIMLKFNLDDIIAEGIYDFTYDFFDDLFEMGRYSSFCIKEDLEDLIEENIRILFSKYKKKTKQFRILKDNQKYYLRAMTSDKYNNCDNNMAIYISLLLLHNVSKKEKIEFNLKHAYISDSVMRIFFEQNKYRKINGLGNIYFGVLLTNGEIKNSEFSLEIYYKIVDEKDKNVNFIGIPELKDSIFNINHITSIDKLINKVENIYNLPEIEKTMFSFIKDLNEINYASENVLYSLMLKITQSRILLKQTRENFKDLKDKNLINNSMTLLQVFNKVNQITSDIDEKIYLQRIYNDVINEVLNHN